MTLVLEPDCTLELPGEILKIHIPRLALWGIVLSLEYLKSAQVIVITAKFETHYFRAGNSNGSQAGVFQDHMENL